MSIPFIKVGVQDPSLRAQIDPLIKDIFDSSGFIGGKHVDGFAKEFADFCGGGYCAPLANGTDALIIALKALGVGAGDEVITVPFTFIASAEAITAVGATPKFVDIEAMHYTMDPALLKKAVTSRTKAIIPVHLFGHPADMDAIMALAKEKNLHVVEDACQAHGAEYKGKRVGTLGHLSAFSFYPTKNLGACGDAGAVVSSNEALIKKVVQIGDHGRSGRYWHEIEGLNSRMDSIQAAVLRVKLKTLDAANERRRKIGARYNDALKGNKFISAPAISADAKTVYHLYSVESDHRDALSAYLTEKGIGNGVYYPIPLHLQPAYARCGYKKGDFPVSERAAERILSLPLFPEMDEAQIGTVCQALRDFTA